MMAGGQMESESKKQGSRLKRELKKITENLGGIRKMGRVPGVVVAIDVRKEYIALREARKLGIATIGVIDTDADPDTVDVAIPANDDSLKAIEIIMNELAQAVAEGKTMVKPEDMPAQGRQPRQRSRRRVLASAGEGGEGEEQAAEAADAAQAETAQ